MIESPGSPCLLVKYSSIEKLTKSEVDLRAKQEAASCISIKKGNIGDSQGTEEGKSWKGRRALKCSLLVMAILNINSQ